MPGLGESATAAFLVSILSGFVVAMQYEAAVPFISSVSIDAELPFGKFWRSLHFWSSQFFVIFLISHVVQRFDALPRISTPESHATTLRKRWFTTGITLPLAILALFTGYVLRFDGTGQAAGAIAEHLILEIPLLGNTINRFFMAVEREGVNRVYAVHIIFTALCWGIGTWYHTRKVLLKSEQFFIITFLSVLWASFIGAPIDIPGENVLLIKGPWFFVGVQELLRDLPAAFAGIIFPSIPIALVLFLPWFKDRKTTYYLLCVWTVLYLFFTVKGFIRN